MKGMLHRMAAKASWEKLSSTFVAWKKFVHTACDHWHTWALNMHVLAVDHLLRDGPISFTSVSLPLPSVFQQGPHSAQKAIRVVTRSHSHVSQELPPYLFHYPCTTHSSLGSRAVLFLLCLPLISGNLNLIATCSETIEIRKGGIFSSLDSCNMDCSPTVLLCMV